MIITLPSGLAGEIRGLKGKEAQALADPSMARGARNIDAMLQGCFVRVDDPGIYKFDAGGPARWDDVLLGDRFAALINIRCLSWGPDYEFRVRCSECQEGYEWELDLRDLPQRALPESSRAQLRDGQNKFECVGPGGEDVAYRLLLGRDEKAMLKAKQNAGGRWGVVDALDMQILSVAGVGEKGSRTRAWLEEQDVRPLHELLAALQAIDCGVDTAIETECTRCGWQQEIQLPFAKTFFYPRTKPKPKIASAAPSR